MTDTRARTLLVLASMTLGLGCYNSDFFSNQATMLPPHGQLGTGTAAGNTVAMLVDSNYRPFGDSNEKHQLHPDNVDICVQVGVQRIPASVRGVFELRASRRSVQVGFQPGLSGTVVLFDLPGADAFDNPPLTLPVLATVKAVFKTATSCATPLQVITTSKLELTGSGGAPNPVFSTACLDEAAGLCIGQTFVDTLDPTNTLRLRGKRGTNLFSSTEPVGAVQFDITYNVNGYDCVDRITAAHPATEAYRGSAYVTPVADSAGATTTQSVVILHDIGFTLPELSASTDATLIGNGPFIDLLIKRNPATANDCNLAISDWFEIDNVVVTRPDGSLQFEASAPGGVGVTHTTGGTGANPGMVFRMYGLDRG